VLTPEASTEAVLSQPDGTTPAPRRTANTWALVVFVVVLLVLMLIGGVAVFASLGMQDVGGCGGG
jgi:hypothetical protein